MAEEREPPKAQSSGIFEWIKEHAALVGGSFVGVIALYYLVFMQNKSTSTAAPTSVSFPSQPGGGGPTTTSTSAVTLPFSPDFSVLKSITDNVLQSLYGQAYTIELQINQAVQAGQDTTMLYSQLSAIQSQIASYVPVATTTPAAALNIFNDAIYGSGIPGGTASSAASRTDLFGALFPDLSATQAKQLSDAFHYYGAGGGSTLSQTNSITLWNNWLSQVRAGQGANLVTSIQQQFNVPPGQ